MDHVPDGAHVRLRSRARAAYLHADEDGVGVSLRPRRRRGRAPSLNAVWQLHRVAAEGGTFVLLHGAAYGRYLSASPDPEVPPGHRAVQRDLGEHDLGVVLWRASAVGDGSDYVRLRHTHLNRDLRANGRYRVWRTGVTVDYDGGRPSTMMHWKVEVLPLKSEPPALPLPTLDHGGLSGLFRWGFRPGVSGRMIRYVRANDEGDFNQNHDEWGSFFFFGRSVFNLRIEVASRCQPDMNIFGITMCVRPGLHGRLTPLVTDLPRSIEPMDIVVLTTGSPAADALWYTNI